VRNNSDNTYTRFNNNTALLDQNGSTTDGFGALQRFVVGGGTNADTGTFTVDDIQLEDTLNALFAPTPAPEPSSIALLGFGAFFALRRRRADQV
jgi:hypothetical protein